MKEKYARKLSEALLTIHEGYKAKANGTQYSALKLSASKYYIDRFPEYLERHAGDTERDFMYSALAELDDAFDTKDALRISDVAYALHKVPFIFCGREKWSRAFKDEYITPVRRRYGSDVFDELVQMTAVEKYVAKADSRTIYRFNDINITSFPFFLFIKFLAPIIILSFMLCFSIYLYVDSHFGYTEDSMGKRYDVTVSSYDYSNVGDCDFLTLYCEGYNDPFEAPRFFEYSDRPEYFTKDLSVGDRLVIYAEHINLNKGSDYYKIVHLETPDGTVYRTYTHTNAYDSYTLPIKYKIILVVTVLFFVPSMALLIPMLIIARNPEKYKDHPRLLKFLFNGYSLPLNKYKGR